MSYTRMATKIAVTAPAAPAFGASQRRGTKSQKSTRTGNPASAVDQNARQSAREKVAALGGKNPAAVGMQTN